MYARIGPESSMPIVRRYEVKKPCQLGSGSIDAYKIWLVRRMGRLDVVARMLIELLDKDCIRAVAEAMAGLQTEEAVQAVVQVSLTLASADRPDVVADVSAAPSLCLRLSQWAPGLHREAQG